jgi:ParB family chromosome partitioning protein
MTVREAEGLSRSQAEAKGRLPAVRAQKDADTLALERQLSEALGLKVEIVNKARVGGTLTVRYTTLEQLDDVCNRLAKSP